MNKHEERIGQIEEQVSTEEDMAIRHQRMLWYLLHHDIDLSAKCENLQNRLRRNNMRIFLSSQKEVRENIWLDLWQNWSKRLWKYHQRWTLRLREHIAHWERDPKAPVTPPSSIILRFLDTAVKDKIIRQAWNQKQVFFKISGSFLIMTTPLTYKVNEDEFTKP